MSNAKLFRKSYRVAVLGGFQAGKTVFTTALLNHIKHHDPSRLKLGKASKAGPPVIVFDRDLPPYGRATALPTFPYAEYRSAASKRWPQKTKATAAYRCRFFRSDWGATTAELLVVDVPGERYADLPMATRSFSQWSEWLFDTVFAAKDNRTQTEEYRKAFETGQQINADSILKAYKNTLVRFYQSFRPFVTPSTFILQENGVFHGVSVFRDSDISGTLCGLSEDTQFAPLPSSVKVTAPALYGQFEKAYNNYRRQLVKPLCSVLKSVNQVIVLVDVTSLLAGSTAMKNGYRLLLEELLEVLSPGYSTLGWWGNALTTSLTGGHFDGSGIEKLAVVATKADKVLKADLEDDKLLNLLKSMVGGICDRHRQRASGLSVQYFTVAATKSARNLTQDSTKKRGVLDGTANESVYETSSLPDHWPATWGEGNFSFPDVEPCFPDDEQQAPDHIHMDQIMNFLLDFS
jgi:predicted YcjX-like family ATPase